MAGRWVNSRGSKSSFLAALGLVGQTKVGVDAKGNLATPFLGLDGKPLQWVEVAPFVWRAQGASHERLAAKVVDGKVVRFSFDMISPFMVFDRAPWYEDTGWLLPLVIISLAALLLTAIFWPVTAIVRRSFGAKLALDAGSLRAYRWSKLAALAILIALTLWGVTLSRMISDTNNLNAKFDATVHLAQLLGFIAFIGGCAVLWWHVAKVWGGGGRRWPAKLWSVVLALSATVILWMAFVFKLLTFSVSY
jgi:hypothetical protein